MGPEPDEKMERRQKELAGSLRFAKGSLRFSSVKLVKSVVLFFFGGSYIGGQAVWLFARNEDCGIGDSFTIGASLDCVVGW